jgi:lipid II isoglutaminyl synthase (glutamine-hydrolysing)
MGMPTSLPTEALAAGSFVLTPNPLRQQAKCHNPFQLWLATRLAKGAAWAALVSGKGAGTSLPGKIARKIAPHVLTQLAQQVTGLVVGVTGTNGKTTTCGVLATWLKHSLPVVKTQKTPANALQRVVHNQLGANMVPGITTAMVLQTSPLGRLHAETAVIEVDEASLRRLTPECPLDAVVVTNLFRDQLDRYGELDTTAQLILEGAGPAMPLILNADDPLVAAMAQNRTAPVWYFGVNSRVVTPLPEKAFIETAITEKPVQVPFATEVHQCPVCGNAALHYTEQWYGHLGHFACPACHYTRPIPHVEATLVNVGIEGSQFVLTTPLGQTEVTLPLPGLFNVYNVLAAATAALLAGAQLDQLNHTLGNLPAVFGRAEVRQVAGCPVRVMLIKNPVGATEVLRCVGNDPTAPLVVMLNDLDADGRDVSWIWDAEFERVGTQRMVTVAGKRAWDMATRLKYANVPLQQMTVLPDLTQALQHALANCPPGQTVYVLPTYTALLALQPLWAQLES